MTFVELSYQEKVDDFLAQKRIAVCGLSRSKETGAGAIYLKLRENNFDVVPIHPEAEALYDDTCYPNLSAIPGGVDAVFIMNSPDISEGIVYEAANLGIKHVWMHDNTMMPSSVSQVAVDFATKQNMNVIDVGCPIMFFQPDFFHSCMRWIIKARGKMK